MGESKEPELSFDEMVAVIRKDDARYDKAAYGFLAAAMNLCHKGQGERQHLTAREVLDGMCESAKIDFGMMACCVFEQWGIHSTDDVGEMVFSFVDRGFCGKTEDDKREDFHNAFDLKAELQDYEIEMESE